MQRYLLLSTAGHIDHGKTSLIKALTGVNTDRLPEEKRRGITVDLGFAALELDDLLIGVVDVPGHERFIKNMLAGATGVDLALLVVAADESVMPQTREHFEALSYLNIQAGVVAITKCDLVDDEMLTLVKDDISQLVANSFLQHAAQVCVSTKTGDGLPELRAKLVEVADRLPKQSEEGPFRLSVDRCFSAPGQGTVVTGSVVSGVVSSGAQLQLFPQAVTVTVRGIESHGKVFETIRRGQRTALNLSGVHFRDVTRGDILVSPGSVIPSKLQSVRIKASEYLTRSLKARTPIRFYCGATETAGRLRLLGSNSLAAGETQIGQVELQQEICTCWGEPFVLRGLAANEVIGGGQIVDPLAQRVGFNDAERVSHIRELSEGSPAGRASAVAALCGTFNWEAEQLQQRAGIANCSEVVARLVDEGVLCRFDCKGSSRWLHRSVVAQLEARFVRCLAEEHQQDCLSAQIPLGRLRRHFVALEPIELLSLLAKRLASAGQLQIQDESVSLAEWEPRLTANQSMWLEEILVACKHARFTPPSVGELAAKLDVSVDEVESLLKVGTSTNELVALPDKDPRDAKAAQRARLYLHRSNEKLLVDQLHLQLADYPEWTLSQFAEAMGLSRKYAIPLCNHLDQIGITARQGDLRKIVSPTSTNV